jgi:cation transport ATPase
VNTQRCQKTFWPYPVDLQQIIAIFALSGIILSLIFHSPYPLYAVLGFGGGPLLFGLMLSGGQAIENFNIYKTSHVLEALANRAPTIAHRKEGDKIVDLPVDEIKLNDILVIYPHETCPSCMIF